MYLRPGCRSRQSNFHIIYGDMNSKNLVNFYSPRLDEKANAGEMACAKKHANNHIFLYDFFCWFDD